MKFVYLTFLIVTLSLPTHSVAAPEFLAYEGRNAIHDGQGGNKKVVDGIDFWSNGEPPRKFKVLGILNDRRHKTGLVGLARMSGLEGDIAKAARNAGGDAVILQLNNDEVVGVAGYGNTNTDGHVNSSGDFHSNSSQFSGASTIMKHNSSYIVVKYLPESELVPAEVPAQAVR